MTKEEVVHNEQFIRRCQKYGLSCENCEIVDDLIIVNTPKSNIKVILDNHYNTVGIYDRNDSTFELTPSKRRLNDIKQLYETTSIKLPHPFQDLSIKQINELGRRVYVYDTNNGHCFDMVVNEDVVNDDFDNVYVSLLLYVKYLYEHIKEYYVNLYQMKMKGIRYPDIYTYLKSLMENIDECILNEIKEDSVPVDLDISKHLGKDMDYADCFQFELEGIINLLLAEKGFRITCNEGGGRDLEPIENDCYDVSIYAKQLLKILEVTDEEFDEKRQKSRLSYNYTEINLQSWLSKNSKEKPTLLIKTEDN